MLSLHMDAKREQDGGDKKRALVETKNILFREQ